MEEKPSRFKWTRTIKANIFMLKCVGLWPGSDELYKFSPYTIYTATVFILFVFGHNFFQFCKIFFVLNDLKELSGIIYILQTQLMCIFKSYYFMRNLGSLQGLIDTLESDLFQPKTVRQIALVRPSLKFWTRIVLMYWAAALTAALFWAIFPIVDGSIKSYRLPFVAWYPYNTERHPVYELTYIYQILGILFLGVLNINIDNFIAALNMFTGAQCDILADDLRNLNDEDDFDEKVVNCVIHHKEILRFAEKSNKFFNNIVFLQFFTSGLSLAFTLFQMSIVKPFSSEFYNLLFYGGGSVIELFSYCWFGNETEYKSNAIPQAAFESDWMHSTLPGKRSLLIFIVRTQSPIKVSAFNIFDLSLATYVKILRTAWSYFAILQQLTNKNVGN